MTLSYCSINVLYYVSIMYLWLLQSQGGEQVSSVVSRTLRTNAKQAAAFLALMGSAHRLTILAYLINEEMSVNVLGKKMGLSKAFVSTYLSQLRRLGLVDARRDSHLICYSCKANAVRELFSVLEARYGEGSASKLRGPATEET